jgi:hypothetical protein
MDPKEGRVLKETPVLKEYKEKKDLKEIQEIQETPVLLAHKEILLIG